METIDRRRSVRKYQGRPVESEKIEKLLRAAMQAPSAGNQQPWEFLVVQDKSSLARLSVMNPDAKLVGGAPLAFILLGNELRMHYPEHWEQDLAAAAVNILLEAVELNLGAVWIGVAPHEDRMNHVKSIFALPDNLKPFCLIAVGYPLDGQGNNYVDRYDGSRVHYEKL